MPFCPVDREEFQPGVFVCPEHHVSLVGTLPPEQVESQPTSGKEVGIFNRFVAPVLVDLLAEHGIHAIETDRAQGIYRTARPNESIVIVGIHNLAEARRLAADVLPERLRELEEATGSDPSFAGDQKQEPVPVADPWAAATEDDDEVEEYDGVPIGFMEPAVARVFIGMCEEVDIGADSEYPLDEPPPAYARADGRVRIHVEDILVDHALSLMNDELADELARRGVSYKEPILEAEES